VAEADARVTRVEALSTPWPTMDTDRGDPAMNRTSGRVRSGVAPESREHSNLSFSHSLLIAIFFFFFINSYDPRNRNFNDAWIVLVPG
jgi:hypothetical protein